MYVRHTGRKVGFGDTAQTLVGTTISAGAPIAIAAAESASLTVPIIGAAIAGVTAIIGIFMANAAKYHGQESATTKIADQTSALMKQNLAAWNASQKTAEEQQQALANFDQLEANMEQQCLQSQYGDPGKRCASERERGGKYDQYASFRDPIANDPAVSGSVSIASSLLPGGSVAGIPSSLLLGAGLIAAAWMLS